MNNDPHHHHTESEIHHHETQDDVLEAKTAVVAAVAAVAAADIKMDSISHMLTRHFKLGVLAVGAASILGLSIFYAVLKIEQSQTAEKRRDRQDTIQVVANEVEIIRHRVHEREGHRRLCIIALGASRPIENAVRICDPVVGEDYKELQEKLAKEEANLAKLRAAA